jgi:hypothetical protein
VVATSTPAGFPTRPYSALTIGGLFPFTDPGDWSDAALSHRQKAASLLESADAIRRTADGVPAEGQSGHTIDGFTDASHRLAQTVTAHADEYFTMAGAADEVGRLISGLREDLDNIDRDANQQIQQVLSSGGGAFSAAAKVAQLNAIVAQARADATTKSTAASGAIGKEGTKLLGSGTSPKTPGTGTNGAGGQPDPSQVRSSPDDTIVGPHSGPNVVPAHNGSGGPIPEHGPGGSAPALGPGGDRGRLQPLAGPGGGRGGLQPLPGNGLSNQRPGGGQLVKGSPTSERGGLESGGPAQFAPPLPGFPGGGGGGLPGGLGGGLPGGLGGGGIPSSGLANFSPASSLTSPSSLASSTDFSRGLGAGLGAGGAPAAPLMPPVPPTPPSEPMATSGAPSGAFVPGPAPVSAAGGGQATSLPPATPAAVASPGGGATALPAAMGPLPPFGSDIPRSAAAAAGTAAVIPASGAPSAPPSAPIVATGAAAPVAPLPPGVVGSGVGASAAAGAEAVRSALPDPLLASAAQLVYQLLHDSRLYPFLDWCVGVFKTPSGVETVVVSSEGAGYIPVGVFAPRSVHMLFSDEGLTNGFRARWFGWANPTEPMLAYAELLADHNPNIKLYALAVSNSQGGSSLPARDAGVTHFEDCSLLTSPIPRDAAASELDEAHVHRLETFDAALYARLTDVGGATPPDRSRTWKATVAAVARVLDRATALRDLAVPSVIREILQALTGGIGVDEDRWAALEMEHLAAAANSASHRPGRMLDSEGASPYARAHHNLARVTELLAMWRDKTPKYPEIEYVIKQIELETELWPSGGGE